MSCRGVLHLPHESHIGRSRNGAELRARGLGTGAGLRARLPVAGQDSRARARLRREIIMSYQNILFDITGGVARLTLNRPDRLNSFNTAMHAEVREALGSLGG